MPEQENSWPRTGATDIYGNAFATNVIPLAVERATYEAAFFESTNPGSLNETIQAGRIIKSETIGPISTTFMDTKDASTATRYLIPTVETRLASVLTGGISPFGITGLVA